MREGASPWMNTRFTRPRSTKSLTYSDPQAADSVLLMSAMLSPSALAFSQSMLNRYCGSSSKPLARTCVELRILARQAKQLVARRHELLVALVGAVHEFQVEARRVAQFLHRGRREGEGLRIRYLAEVPRWPARPPLARGSFCRADRASPSCG